jgi:ribonuclease HII
MRGLMAGADEAGRGSILGPLVVAAVAARGPVVRRLVQEGVQDSKALTPERRRELYHIIHRWAEGIEVVKIPPAEVDRWVLEGRPLRRLNYLEAVVMGRALRALKVREAYVDSPDRRPERFAGWVAEHAGGVRVHALNKADRLVPVVSAASIIAKVERDLELEALKALHGELGSGYPHDPLTRRFLKRCLKEGFEPPFARRSWRTWRSLRQETIDRWV